MFLVTLHYYHLKPISLSLRFIILAQVVVVVPAVRCSCIIVRNLKLSHKKTDWQSVAAVAKRSSALIGSGSSLTPFAHIWKAH